MKNKISKINWALPIKLALIKFFSEVLYPFSKIKRRELRARIDANIFTKKITFEPDKNFDPNTIPIFIISYNRLKYVQQTITSLEKHKLSNIHIVDNKSDYKPLLEYLHSIKYPVHFLNKNYGQNVVWECDEFRDYIEKGMYIVTDPDLEFNPSLPENFITVLYKLLGSYPNITKVGFALKINDLPYSDFSDKVKEWEGKFWEKKLSTESQDVYYADLDTTFALYRPGKLSGKCFYKAIRVAGDFTARHLPWYELFEKTEENLYYKQTALIDVASWTKDSEHFDT